MKLFATEYNSPLTNNPMLWSKTHIEETLLQIVSGKGFILIDEKNRGLLIAMKIPVFWIPKMFQLHELMLRSDNKITTIKLIKEYIRCGKDMLDFGSIVQITMPTSSDVDLSKIGMEKINSIWVMQ